ncbi:ECF transporter S component [Paenibacillus contaminans]|uniref:Thiamine ABC transporter permease n=1 Tax=Paenibacillus contaminans TaxID=450362 RepID=A0A329MPS3_9BACL|nr:ECF transporter S component [Paenibacillus contaminans]RAV21602.1 thiamine ABC transporter permease [Paenibacillus contaminans]
MKEYSTAKQVTSAFLHRRKGRWNTKDILVAGMIAVVFAFVQLGITYAFMAASASVGPVYARLLNGFWFMSGFMALSIIRKPGIGFISQAIAGIVMTPLTPFGIMILFGALVNGLLTELVFFLTRYKHYSFPILAIGMCVLSIVYTLLEFGPSGYGGLALPVQIAILATSAISGAICGWLCKRLTDSLLRTGLLSGYSHSRT